MNKAILIGRLTRDPEIRWTQGEKSMCIARYTLAVNRIFKREGEAEADFINCIAFGRQGEFADRYLKQGTKIAVCGRIQTGSYTNKEGRKVYTTDVIIEGQEFAESKAKGEGKTTKQDADPHHERDGFMTIPVGAEEELPFI